MEFSKKDMVWRQKEIWKAFWIFGPTSSIMADGIIEYLNKYCNYNLPGVFYVILPLLVFALEFFAFKLGINDMNRKIIIEDGSLKLYAKGFKEYKLKFSIRLDNISFIKVVNQKFYKMGQAFYYIIYEDRRKKYLLEQINNDEAVYSNNQYMDLYSYLQQNYNIKTTSRGPFDIDDIGYYILVGIFMLVLALGWWSNPDGMREFVDVVNGRKRY